MSFGEPIDALADDGRVWNQEVVGTGDGPSHDVFGFILGLIDDVDPLEVGRIGRLTDVRQY